MAELTEIIFRRAQFFFLALLFLSPFVALLGAQENQGVLEIRLKDHRDAIGDFAKLDVLIEEVLLSHKSRFLFWRSDWRKLRPIAESADLTQYVEGKTARLFRGTMDAAMFDAFHLKIKRIEGLLKKNRRIIEVKDSLGPVRLAFEVRPRQETLLIVDLVVTDFSDHPPRGYELALKGYELYIDNKRLRKIPPG